MKNCQAPLLRTPEPLSLKNHRRFTADRCPVMTKSLINADRIGPAPAHPQHKILIMASRQPNHRVPSLRSAEIPGTPCSRRRKANH
jgi:hypothetical protein